MVMDLVRSHVHQGIIMYTPHQTDDHNTIPKMEGLDEQLQICMVQNYLIS